MIIRVCYFTIKNTYIYSICITGEAYTIEQRIIDEWTVLPIKPRKDGVVYAFNNIGNELSPHSSRQFTIHVNRKIHVKLFHRHLVDAGRTMVAPDTHPGVPKVSRFYNLVNQFHLLNFVLLVNIPWNVPAASDLGDYDSPDTVLSHFRTTKALLTAICTIYTLTPSMMDVHLLWTSSILAITGNELSFVSLGGKYPRLDFNH